MTASELPNDIDSQCVQLCKAINAIPGLETTESCAGHGAKPMRIWFRVSDLTQLPKLLYYLDPCHVGFRWRCEVYTDCGMAPARFLIESESKGDQSYKEAAIIAQRLEALYDAQ